MIKQKRQKIDLTYKKTAIRTTYDIESMYDLFTIALINKKGLRLILFGNEKFTDLTKNELINQMKSFAKRNDYRFKEAFDIDNVNTLSYDVRLYNTENVENLYELQKDLNTMIMCNIFDNDLDLAKDLGQTFRSQTQTFNEYVGWNSANYDLLMLVMCYLYMRKVGARNVKPSDFRRLSNTLISFNKPPFLLYEYVEEQTKGAINRAIFKHIHNMAIWRDGHIDWAKIISSGNVETGERESIMPPALKREMAKLGMDVILDENVTEDGPLDWSDEDKANLVEYNFNDVLGTLLIGDRQVVKGSLETRDNLVSEYPYTSARSTPMEKLNVWSPNQRDETPARLSSLVIVGPYRSRPKDNDEVSFLFPLPNENGDLEEKDLLDHIMETEEFVHPYLFEFFNHFRGKDTRTYYDDYKIKKSQPITNGALINIPYYRNGKPTDAYIRASTGGAHGSVCVGLSKLSEDEIKNWIISDVGATDEQKPTIDVRNVIHIDWASFYPTMVSRLKMYVTSEGIDRYSEIISKRISIKNSLPFDKADWTEIDYINNNRQNSYKLALNSPTGAGNMHQEHALLPLDNKTLSMRLIGNMMIWVMGQRLTQFGAYVISTNTDGLYVTNISLEDAQKVIDGYIKDYGLPVDPEVIDRLINRDTSNRVEYIGGHRQNVGGRLRHGASLHYTDSSIGYNIPYPLITANAVLEYMDQDDWLQKPYNQKIMRDYIEKCLTKDNLEAFYHVHIGSKKTKLLLNGEKQQRINRLLLTKDGLPLTQSSSRQLNNQNMLDLWNHSIDNLTFEGVKFHDTSDVLWYGDIKENRTLEDLILMRKVKQGRDEYYLEVDIPRIKYDLDTWKEMRKEYGFAYLGLKSEARIEEDEITGLTKLYDIEPLSKWNEGVLTGYPDNAKGELVNLSEELNNFDISKIDIGQYLEWAESLLETWKVSANLDEVGMKKIDDTVIKKKVKKRLTKKERAINFIYEMYENIGKEDKCIY